MPKNLSENDGRLILGTTLDSQRTLGNTIQGSDCIVLGTEGVSITLDHHDQTLGGLSQESLLAPIPVDSDLLFSSPRKRAKGCAEPANGNPKSSGCHAMQGSSSGACDAQPSISMKFQEYFLSDNSLSVPPQTYSVVSHGADVSIPSSILLTDIQAADVLDGQEPTLLRTASPIVPHDDPVTLFMPNRADINLQSLQDVSSSDHHMDNELPAPSVQNTLSMNTVQEDFTLEFTEDVVSLDDATPVPNLNEGIYEGAGISVKESLTSILSFAQSENISGAGLRRLLSLIALHLHKPNNFFESDSQLFKLLEDKDEPFELFYFCSVCYKECMSSSDLCTVCNDDNRFVHYFLSFSVESQLRKLYSRPSFLEDIKYKSRRVKVNPSNIEDIYDGELYKELEHDFLTEDTYISFTWNSDGVQLFNSSSFSLWPMYLVVNELAPEKRFRSENMIIAGLWGSVAKPHPNIYLQRLQREMVVLENGIDVVVHDGSPRRVRAKIFGGTGDAPARALLLNIKLHSGFFSCHVCQCHGVKLDSVVFPFERDVPLRNKQNYAEQVRWAVENRVLHNPLLLNEPECCGVKGPTLLSCLVRDIFASTAIDSMHCLYSGLMRQLLHLWTDYSFRKKEFSIYDKVKELNVRLRNLTPPHFLQRTPQTIEKLIFWKASELRSFLFHTSICVLNGLLSDLYLSHFLKLVAGVSVLNSSSISLEDVQSASRLLHEFVEEFEALYELQNMSYNLHLVTHLALCVQRLGPLWALSCFPFEDMNGRLGKLMHGTRHACMQIYSNMSVLTSLPLLVQNLGESNVKDYCKRLRHKYMNLKISERIKDGVYSVGDYKDISDTFSWIVDVLHDENVLPDTPVYTLKIFHRLIQGKLLYVSSSYDRGKRVSSYVKYRSRNSFVCGNIICFVAVKSCVCRAMCSCSSHYVAIIRRLETNVAFQTQSVAVNHVLLCDMTNYVSTDVVNIQNLQTVLYKIEVADKIYLSEPLNKFELE